MVGAWNLQGDHMIIMATPLIVFAGLVAVLLVLIYWRDRLCQH